MGKTFQIIYDIKGNLSLQLHHKRVILSIMKSCVRFGTILGNYESCRRGEENETKKTSKEIF